VRVQTNGRGAYPKVTEDTLALFVFDSAVAVDLVGGRVLSAIGGTVPSAAIGPVGGSLVFDGVDDYRRAVALAGDAAAMRGDWTITTCFRLTGAPTANDTICAFVGNGGDGDANQNFLFALRVDATGSPLRNRLNTLWEFGTGSNVETFMDAHRLRLGRYIWTTHRKRGPVGAEAGPKVLDVFVGGVLVETFDGLADSADGDSGAWNFGGALNAAETGPGNEAAVDIAFVHVEAAVLGLEEIRENARRGLLLGFPLVVYGRARMEDQAGALQDMTDFEGFDWVRGFSVTENNDSPMRSATLELAREQRGLSLSPLRTDSKLNLDNVADPTTFNPFVDYNREIRLEWAEVPRLLAPETADWQEIFRGDLDSPDWGGAGEAMKLELRDQAGPLLTKYVLEIRDYPQVFGGGGAPPDAAPILDVLQEYLDDNFTPAPTVTARDLSDWFVRLLDPVLSRGHALPTLRGLAANAGGFDVRYLWDDLVEAFTLQMFEPGRDRVDVDLALESSEVLEVTRAAFDRRNVRNFWRVVFPDSAKLDSNGNRLPSVTEIGDAASIARFDEQAAELREGQSSPIDTFQEAEAMRDAALADTKDPNVDASAKLVLMPRLEVHDIASLPGNLPEWTASQTPAIRGVTHEFKEGRGSGTSLDLRGKPSFDPRRWIRLSAGTGLGLPPVKDPTESIRERGIGSLLPIISDVLGRSDYFGGGRLLETKNHDFSRASHGDANPPDGWKTTLGSVWDTNIEFSTTSIRGGRAVSVELIGSALISDPVPVEGGKVFGLHCVWQRTTASPGVSLNAHLVWLDEDRNAISFDFFLFVATAPAGEFQTARKLGFVAPAGTRFLAVRFQPTSNLGGPIIVDQLAAFEVSREFHVFQSENFDLPSGGGGNDTYDRAELDDVVNGEAHDYGGNVDAVAFEFVAVETGFYELRGQITGGVTIAGPGAALAAQARILINGSTVAEGPRVDPLGQGGELGPDVDPVTPGIQPEDWETFARSEIHLPRLFLSRDDVVTLEGRVLSSSNGSNRALVGGERETYLVAKLIATE